MSRENVPNKPKNILFSLSAFVGVGVVASFARKRAAWLVSLVGVGVGVGVGRCWLLVVGVGVV